MKTRFRLTTRQIPRIDHTEKIEQKKMKKNAFKVEFQISVNGLRL